ncbi:hypothetical protein N9L68_06435 [bacterium]|nr:hypothetical protein [bacterium]
MLTGVTAVGTHIQSNDRRLCSLHGWAMLFVGRWRQINRPGVGKYQMKGTQRTRRSGRATRCHAWVIARTPSQRVSVALEVRVPLPVGGKEATPISRCSRRRLHCCTKKEAAAVAVAVAALQRSSVHQRERQYSY